jgi:Domain of unknown function (DUF4388)
MAQQNATITNSLANVIQVIQLGRKSGVLTVERGEGMTFEEGVITFVNGQAIDAQAALFNFQDALRWLGSWGTCRYEFIPTPTSKMPAMPASVSASAFDRGTTDTGTHPRVPTSPLRESAARRQASNGRMPAISLMPASIVPHPAKSLEESLRRVEQLSFSRHHRRLLLLIDGQRNIAEMVRLIGHTQYEVQKLLVDLEQAGIIQL